MKTRYAALAAALIILCGTAATGGQRGGKNLIGKDLTGWKTRDDKNGWKVEKGVLVNTPPSSDLISEEKFWNFDLHYEFLVPKGGNSGMYLRGRYEIQILDDYGKPTAMGGNGSIYSQAVAKVNASKPAGEWQSVDVKLVDRKVVVRLNGQQVIDHTLTAVTGGALDNKEEEPGPIMLQGDHGSISFRNIRIRKLPGNPKANP